MSAADSLLLFACAVGAGYDLGDGHYVRGTIAVVACLAFAIASTVKR